MTRLTAYMCLGLAMLLSLIAPYSSAQNVSEYEMKAAYLYNFAAFTQWPVASNEAIKLCILGKDKFGGALEKLARKSVNGVRIKLFYLPNIESAHTCQILFIDAVDDDGVIATLKQLEKMPVLTVTDRQELYMSGVMIGLFLDNNRLAFDVNYEMAKNANLSISSQLLRVARTVK